jgi:lysozyme family protein
MVDATVLLIPEKCEAKMAASSYDEALARLLVHEGGYSNHPSDPGGPTNWGITIFDARAYWKKDATAADVRDMPVEVAKDIYRSKYWGAMRCDELPTGVDYAAFDYGVNSGIGRSGRVLRRILGLSDQTSAITDEVIAAAKRRNAAVVIDAICDERLAFLQGLRTWSTFGNGWGRRVREVRAAALAMSAGKPAGATADKDLAGKIVAAMRAKGYRVDSDEGHLNIVYVEGMNVDGTPNDNAPNQFNDLRAVIRFVGGKPVIAGAWEGTTEPSRRWTQDPMNPKGAARIAFGQYTAWQTGVHHDHEALVQVAPVTVHRDLDKDYKRGGDVRDTGLFGINQHWGYDLPRNDLGNSSAGCLVGRSKAGHRAFMALIKTDKRYAANPGYRFTTTILPADAASATARKDVSATARKDVSSTTRSKKVGFGAAIAAAAGAVAHWIDGHPVITIGAVVMAVLLVLYVIRHLERGD